MPSGAASAPTAAPPAMNGAHPHPPAMSGPPMSHLHHPMPHRRHHRHHGGYHPHAHHAQHPMDYYGPMTPGYGPDGMFYPQMTPADMYPYDGTMYDPSYGEPIPDGYYEYSPYPPYTGPYQMDYYYPQNQYQPPMYGPNNYYGPQGPIQEMGNGTQPITQDGIEQITPQGEMNMTAAPETIEGEATTESGATDATPNPLLPTPIEGPNDGSIPVAPLSSPPHAHHGRAPHEYQRRKYPTPHTNELDKVGPMTYKTEICRSHQATGQCEYGATCQFAHGMEELRSREVDLKYKTELCKNYHSGGPQSCWYGSRCKFIHDEYRLRAGEYEFWLLSPSENLVRVERVDPSNTARCQQLIELVNSPPNQIRTPPGARTQIQALTGQVVGGTTTEGTEGETTTVSSPTAETLAAAARVAARINSLNRVSPTSTATTTAPVSVPGVTPTTGTPATATPATGTPSPPTETIEKVTPRHMNGIPIRTTTRPHHRPVPSANHSIPLHLARGLGPQTTTPIMAATGAPIRTTPTPADGITRINPRTPVPTATATATSPAVTAATVAATPVPAGVPTPTTPQQQAQYQRQWPQPAPPRATTATTKPTNGTTTTVATGTVTPTVNTTTSSTAPTAASIVAKQASPKAASAPTNATSATTPSTTTTATPATTNGTPATSSTTPAPLSYAARVAAAAARPTPTPTPVVNKPKPVDTKATSTTPLSRSPASAPVAEPVTETAPTTATTSSTTTTAATTTTSTPATTTTTTTETSVPASSPSTDKSPSSDDDFSLVTSKKRKNTKVEPRKSPSPSTSTSTSYTNGYQGKNYKPYRERKPYTSYRERHHDEKPEEKENISNINYVTLNQPIKQVKKEWKDIVRNSITPAASVAVAVKAN